MECREQFSLAFILKFSKKIKLLQSIDCIFNKNDYLFCEERHITVGVLGYNSSIVIARSSEFRRIK